MNKKLVILVCILGGIVIAGLLVVIGVLIGQNQILNQANGVILPAIQKPLDNQNSTSDSQTNSPTITPPEGAGVGTKQDYTFKYKVDCEGCRKGEFTVKFSGPTGLTSEQILPVLAAGGHGVMGGPVGGVRITGNPDYQLSVETLTEMYVTSFDKNRISLVGKNSTGVDIYGILDESGQTKKYSINVLMTGKCGDPTGSGPFFDSPCGWPGIQIDSANIVNVTCTSANSFDACDEMVKSMKFEYSYL